ncbi:MAG: hypothetical protein ACREE0_06205 [Phenylobacterium sp.]
MARLFLPSLAVLASLAALSALPAQAKEVPMTCKATTVAVKPKAGKTTPMKSVFLVGLPSGASELPVGTSIAVVATRQNSPGSKAPKAYKTTDPLKAGGEASFNREPSLNGECTATAEM